MAKRLMSSLVWRLAVLILTVGLLAGCSRDALYAHLDEQQANDVVAALLNNGIDAEKVQTSERSSDCQHGLLVYLAHPFVDRVGGFVGHRRIDGRQDRCVVVKAKMLECLRIHYTQGDFGRCVFFAGMAPRFSSSWSRKDWTAKKILG